jgi:hypothetical protein
MSNRRTNLRPRKSVVALTGAAALMALLTACNNPADGAAATSGTGSAGTTGSNGGVTSTSAPADSGAPSACRPANHTAKITPGPGSAGHIHYEVTLTAAPGYEPCQLAGSPTDAKFSDHGSLKGVTAGTYGDQGTTVNFGPGHPVHFDIQVPDTAGGASADEVTFTLRTPGGGVIPGESFADGSLTVDAGTVIGPVQPGA